jgi:PAS domain S-box-containing protein
MNIKELRPPEDVPLLLNFISHMLPDRDAATVWRHQKKDGTIIDVETTMHPVAFGGRRAELVSATDVTERKRMVDALRESEYSLAEAQRIAHLGNWNWNIFTNELRWSREIFRIFGVREESFAGTVEGFLSLVHPEDRKLVQDSVDEALTQDKAYSLTHRIVRPDGTHRYVHEQAEVFFDSSHKPARMVGTVQDVTEQRSLEAQFQQSQKMEAIGQLAGGVAHDFNNLLTIISGYSQLLVEETQSGNPANGHAREILKAADRAATLTRQLLTFSRRQVLSTQVLDLNVVLGNVDKMLRRLIGEDIDLLTHLEVNLGKVRADPGQVEQIIMNLAVNARDAMPKGGKLTLETANVDLDQAYTNIHFPVKPGPYVMLAVTDTGVGMDATTQAHMFEPFFTTKGQGKGTGLGLATVYGIVKQSSGNIWVYSEVGRGTVFKVYIPRVDDALTQAETPKGAAVARRATETILVVEDEVAVRSLVRGVLSSCGYTVLEASQGDEALTLCDQHKGEIHLVVTDVVMPQMSGRELVARLATMHPSIKVLFMSGYTNEGIVHHGALEKGKAFLQKPFTPAALLGKIRDVLEAVSPAPTPEP